MKSEHRHELKTNELAEWLGNLPQWTKENLKTIIVISVLIVAAAAFYVRYSYRKSAVAQEQLEFTNLLNQLSANKEKVQVLSAQAPGSDFSFMLLPPAESLGNFAQNAKNDQMAAFALIKQAEALRTELHYRPGTVSKQDVTAQINQAKAAYTEAIQTRLRWASNPSLTAAAEFGLGLCEEELGNFEKAQQIYQIIAANPDFEGTVANAAAKHRLDTMADYKQKVIFKPAPAPKPLIATEPIGANQPPDTNVPTDMNSAVDLNLPVDANLSIDTNTPVDVNLILLTPDNISIQVVPLRNRDVLALSADDVTHVLRQAGFSNRQIFECRTDVRNGLEQSGAVQIKINNKLEAVFAISDDSVYISTRQRGNFIYNVNTGNNIPQASDANLADQKAEPNSVPKDSDVNVPGK